MQINVEKVEAGRGSTRLIGEMTIFYANELKQSLLSQLQDVDELEIDLSGVTEIDTTGLQILMLLKIEASNQQKSLQLSGHSQAVVDILDISNLTGFFGDPILLQGKAGNKPEEHV